MCWFLQTHCESNEREKKRKIRKKPEQQHRISFAFLCYVFMKAQLFHFENREQQNEWEKSTPFHYNDKDNRSSVCERYMKRWWAEGKKRRAFKFMIYSWNHIVVCRIDWLMNVASEAKKSEKKCTLVHTFTLFFPYLHIPYTDVSMKWYMSVSIGAAIQTHSFTSRNNLVLPRQDDMHIMSCVRI